MADNYSILGLAPGASNEEIKKAYRRLAMQWHPDKNPSPDARQKFVLITQAYHALLEGKRYSSSTKSYSRPASKPAAPSPPKPGYRAADEKRRETMQEYHDRLMKKFMAIRNSYCLPGKIEANRKKMYQPIYTGFGLAALVLVCSLVLPVISGIPGAIIISFPAGLIIGLRTFWKAGRKKMRADMIFGKEQQFSVEVLRDFFEADTFPAFKNMHAGD